MKKEFCEKWFKNKDKLQVFIEKNENHKEMHYYDLVNQLIEYVLNDSEKTYILNSSVGLNDYSGEEIFVISDNDGVLYVTDNYFGSCSGCDTLYSIQDEHYDILPNDQQIKDYMSLYLSLIQEFRVFDPNNDEQTSAYLVKLFDDFNSDESKSNWVYAEISNPDYKYYKHKEYDYDIEKYNYEEKLQ